MSVEVSAAYDEPDYGEALLKVIAEAIYDTREIVGTEVSRTQAAILAHAAVNAVRNSGFKVELGDLLPGSDTNKKSNPS